MISKRKRKNKKSQRQQLLDSFFSRSPNMHILLIIEVAAWELLLQKSIKEVDADPKLSIGPWIGLLDLRISIGWNFFASSGTKWLSEYMSVQVLCSKGRGE